MNSIPLSKITALIAILLPILSGIIFLTSIIATRNQLAIVRNESAIANNETHIALLYLKYRDSNNINKWNIIDRAKYNLLQDNKKSLEKTRQELSGIPSGLPL